VVCQQVVDRCLAGVLYGFEREGAVFCGAHLGGHALALLACDR
jgi:hypothetical protein